MSLSGELPTNTGEPISALVQISEQARLTAEIDAELAQFEIPTFGFIGADLNLFEINGGLRTAPEDMVFGFAFFAEAATVVDRIRNRFIDPGALRFHKRPHAAIGQVVETNDFTTDDSGSIIPVVAGEQSKSIYIKQAINPAIFWNDEGTDVVIIPPWLNGHGGIALDHTDKIVPTDKLAPSGDLEASEQALTVVKHAVEHIELFGRPWNGKGGRIHRLQ